MKKLLIALLLFPSISMADIQFTWTPPIQNVDGSNLTDLAGYEIQCGDTSGVYTAFTINTADPLLSDYYHVGTYGQLYCVIYAFDTAGQFSPASAEAIYTPTAPGDPAPAAPVNFTATP